MKGKTLATLFSALVLLMSAACSEGGMKDEFENWQSRNDAFIDSLSQAAIRNEAQGITVSTAKEGQVFRMLSFKLDPDGQWGPSEYAYAVIRKSGEGGETPLYSDSVMFHYRGRLIPTPEHPDGYIFDQSYKTDTIDPFTSLPARFRIQSLVEGMGCSLINMHRGDSWRIYIPYNLGYGTEKMNAVPACSTLIFDVDLVDFAHKGEKLKK